MRIVVTGRQGQVVQALAEVAAASGMVVIPVGRPDLDLAVPESVLPALAAARPDVIVSAAAYTAVDRAESEGEAAFAVNARGAELVARAAAALGVPVIHLSTDYVFAGDQPGPYREDDPTGPVSVYGASKLEGERLVAAACADHVILRTAWVYSPFGVNFVKTMMRLGECRSEVAVVADQHGRPTSAHDIAGAIVAIAGRLTQDGDRQLRGTFHLAATGEATWAEFAEAVFAGLKLRGGPSVAVKPIATADYPTAARRPENSRLATGKLADTYGIVLPDWRASLPAVLDRLLPQGGNDR